MLFALAIEPFAESIRSHPGIHGYNARHTTNKISLYADDVLLYITYPQTSIPNLLSTIDQFGTFSGYRINWNKSELMPINVQDVTWLQQLPFRIATEKFRYLGVYITRKYSLLFETNFPPLITKLQFNIQFWKTLPISLLGRVNAIKMIFLPQLLYLVQTVPIYLPKSFFKKLETSIVTNFIWDYKSHRINKQHLCKFKESGGLALPNFRLITGQRLLRP